MTHHDRPTISFLRWLGRLAGQALRACARGWQFYADWSGYDSPQS